MCGLLIDEACALSSGKCLFYDNYTMSIYLTVVTCVAKSGTVLSFLLALYTSKWCEIPDVSGTEDEESSKKQITQELTSIRQKGDNETNQISNDPGKQNEITARTV